MAHPRPARLARFLLPLLLCWPGAAGADDGKLPVKEVGEGQPAASGLTETALKPPVVFRDFVTVLQSVLDGAVSPGLDQELTAFFRKHGMPEDNPRLIADTRRVRLLFEAIRDGGFWHLRWDVTNQEPSSRRIWRAWIDNPVVTDFSAASATAECDEISALLGMLAGKMGVRSVGLFYPTWNHTIAVFAPLGGKVKKSGLIQLPTTQIFLGCDAGFDNTTFKTDLKNIEPYPNWDVRASTLIPGERANFLLEQLRLFASGSPTLWNLVRARRAMLLGSSMGPCDATRREWGESLRRNLTKEERELLLWLGRTELGMRELSAEKVLDWLAASSENDHEATPEGVAK
jgi:hypothetical protein